MVVWTAEKDANLLLGVFEECNIKFGKELYQRLADRIGDGCTAKAIENRIYAFKKNGKGTMNQGSNGTSSATSASKKAATPKAPKSKASSRGQGAKARDVNGKGGPVHDHEEATSPSMDKKRARSKSQNIFDDTKIEDDDGEPVLKKIKQEILDDMEFDSIIGNSPYEDFELDNEFL